VNDEKSDKPPEEHTGEWDVELNAESVFDQRTRIQKDTLEVNFEAALAALVSHGKRLTAADGRCTVLEERLSVLERRTGAIEDRFNRWLEFVKKLVRHVARYTGD